MMKMLLLIEALILAFLAQAQNIRTLQDSESEDANEKQEIPEVPFELETIQGSFELKSCVLDSDCVSTNICARQLRIK